ncbi:hypothetical protein C8R44DRAFT_751942 [Mycena epipterygia]|nr:hypothetical protein C8R44DRAFT_751942 [Mycena epipterygia]
MLKIVYREIQSNHYIAHRDLCSDSRLLNSQGILKLTEFFNAVFVKPETPLSTELAGIVYCRLHVRAKHTQRPSSRNVGSAAQLQSGVNKQAGCGHARRTPGSVSDGVRGRNVTARSGKPTEVGGYDSHHPSTTRPVHRATRAAVPSSCHPGAFSASRRTAPKQYYCFLST